MKKNYTWMPRGRRTEAGVPEKLMNGRFKANRRNRINWKLKKTITQEKQEEIKLLRPHTLSKWQKIAGARMVV